MDPLQSAVITITNKIARSELAYSDRKTTPLSAQEVQQHLVKLQNCATSADQIQLQMTSASKTLDEVNDAEKQFANIENRIIKLSSKFALLLDKLGSSSTQKAVGLPTRQSTDVKLPRLELPTFSGNYSDWLPFHDLFSATIDQNSTLSGAQKLQYLKSSLKEEAAQLIASLQVTNNNYTEAWSLLKERYDNKREIVLSQLDRLFSQPSMKTESPMEIRKLIDTTSEVLRSLTVLNLPVDQWDMILVYSISRKLDCESRRQWELSLQTDDLPSWKELQAFLDRRARALSAAGSDDNKTSSSARVIITAPAQSSGRRNAVTYFGSTGSSCPVCSNNHYIHRCPEFAAYSIQQKKNIVKQHKLCFNCLRGGHFTPQCKGGACRTCGGHHHTLLHSDHQHPSSAPPRRPASPIQPKGQDNNQQQVFKLPQDSLETDAAFNKPPVSTHFARDDDSPARVLLQTALINVEDSSGSNQICRALLDSGSQASFISEECAQRLGFHRKRTHVPLRGISSQQQGLALSYVSFHFVSCYDNKRVFNVDALILSKVTSLLPQIPLDRSNWSHLTGIHLADPTFDVPGKVDILLGADVYGELLLDSKITGKKGTPIAHQSHVGWVLSGKLHKSAELQSITSHHVALDLDLDITLRRFWEIEELPDKLHLTDEEKACEDHFLQTYSRLEDGRFSVSLPFKKDKKPLGESRSIAIRRLKYMERKLSQKDEYYNQYRAFMKEYLVLGHMQLIKQDDIHKSVSEVCYLPHHFVLKESSTTTKFRTVFDASAKTASGFSLNDTLMVGGKLQDDIMPLLIRFRKHSIAMTADIAKMYRQVLIHPQDRDYLRIVWRDSPEMPIQDYELRTVTYGTASAPFQAVRAVQQLALEDGGNFPLASNIIMSDLYMDDLLSGEDTVTQALELQQQLIRLLERGGFNLRKWSSNHPALLESLPEDMRETALPLTFDHDTGIKALGIQWQPSTDTFQYKLSLPPAEENITKRRLLSDIAKLYDPLGWLSPVTVNAKMLMQEVWIAGCGWDHTLPVEIQNKWIQFREDLNAVEDIRIPRYVMQSNCSIIELHGFSDASTVAYGAVVYTRTISKDGAVKVSMVAAKTKVAPIRQLSLPKLELCGAVLVSKLLVTVKKAMKIEVNSTYGWTDNTTVLAWLQSHPSRWSTFVANRVATIQENPITWNHIAGDNNPADCASRGITALSLLTHPLWWNGPQFLQDKDWTAPSGNNIQITDEVIAEQRKTKVVAHISIDMDIINKFSSLPKLQRVAAYCLRFIHNKLHPDQQRSGFLTTRELEQALRNLIKRAQHQSFYEDINNLNKKKPLSSKSKLSSLNPFLDESGLLRVGGRLKEAQISFDKRYPILLPPDHHLTEMIIQHYHLKYRHSGSQLLLASLQQKYWLLRGRDVTRRFVRKCITCFRHSAELANQQMGNLPPERVNPARPFLKCGVDYAGPININMIKGKGRNRKTFKGYIAVFVCFTTKALHLELVSDMSTDAFLAAFRRFISRRGICSDIYSDCGTNFVGAAKELKLLRAQFASQKRNEDIAQQLLSEGVTWHFNPPSAPHMGGIWEAGVKSVKHHLRRTLNETTLDFEEMTTLLTQIEACLNSRPLTPLSSDPDDMAALTPGHFLIGGPLKALPDPDLTHLKMNHLSRWQYLQRLTQHFWKRWSTDYLSKLQQRPRWWSKKENVKTGDLVLIKDDRLPPSSWKLGRIMEVHPGKDNLVRVVNVRVLDKVDSSQTFTYKTFSRPITKLAILPFDSD